MLKEGLIKRPIIPAADTGIAGQEVAPIPWYQFFDDLNRLAIGAAFASAVALIASNMTTATGVARFYRYTGTTGMVLSLEQNLLSQGSENAVYTFTVVDEGDAAGTNPITITAGVGTIDGANSVLITQNYGSINLYTNGTNFFTY